jgi:mono/diheme cytochrome c family protein
MGLRLTVPRLRASATIVVVAGAATLLSACTNTGSSNPDLIAGKKLFAQKCGSCHVLNRAGTKGTVGPDLDQAFQQPLRDGLKRSGIRGLIHDQILYPPSFGSDEGGKRPDGSAPMPAKIVTGEDADNVAAYVASVVSKTGKDSGLLATAVPQAGGGAAAQAKNGTLSIPADPNGQLAFATKTATAPTGKLTVEMPNKSGTPHDIVIDGKGKGAVVKDGAVSKFSASFDAGKYTYYCSVPGHKQAGMQGTLTVK